MIYLTTLFATALFLVPSVLFGAPATDLSLQIQNHLLQSTSSNPTELQKQSQKLLVQTTSCQMSLTHNLDLLSCQKLIRMGNQLPPYESKKALKELIHLVERRARQNQIQAYIQKRRRSDTGGTMNE
ncbi:MAG: hypothetical protein CL676_12460 [Bdellovibrionaceae bacterium]|nr:hypothetical protein [Pseudobdellovibrionaceae bacterium]|tara:strand:- start:2418 stop:2798 length:381 start_codon:yes stop_codon:yes gene_type:complete